MQTFFTILPFIPIALIVFGVLFGLMRGTKKTIIRMVTIMVTTTVLFFIAMPLTGAVAGSFLGDIETSLVTAGLDIEVAQDFIAALLAPVVFFVLFIVVNMVSWIFFAIFTRKVEKKGRLGGAIAGFVSGVFIAVAFMMPINGYLNFINTKHQQITEIAEVLELDELTDALESLNDWMRPLNDYQRNAITRLFNNVNIPLFNMMTNNRFEEVSDIVAEISSALVTIREFISALEQGNFDGLSREQLEEVGAVLDFLTGTFLSGMSLSDIFGVVAEDFNLGQFIPINQIAWLNPSQVDQAVNMVLEAQISEMSFEELFGAVYDARQDPVDAIDAMINQLPSSVRDFINGFRP